MRLLLLFNLMLYSAFIFPQTPPKQEATVYFFETPESFSAVGKWVLGPPGHTDRIVQQEVQIDCFKGNVCIEAAAQYYMGNPHISLSYLDIIRWDKNGIVAETSSGICMTYTILITFADKSLRSTLSPKTLNDKAKQACAFFGAAQASSSIFVVKGTDRWNKEHWEGILPDK